MRIITVCATLFDTWMREFDALRLKHGNVKGKNEMGDASLRKHRPCSEEGRGPELIGPANVQVILHRVRVGHDVPAACILDKVTLRRLCLPRVQSRQPVPTKAQP